MTTTVEVWTGVEWEDISGDVTSIVVMDPNNPGKFLIVGQIKSLREAHNKPSDAPMLSQQSNISGREPRLGGKDALSKS